MGSKRRSRIEWRAVVDRFEGERAILLVGEGPEKVEVPRHLLPPEVQEGDHLRVRWTLDSAARQEAEARLRRWREALRAEGGDFDL